MQVHWAIFYGKLVHIYSAIQPRYDGGSGGVAVNPQTGQADYSAQWAEYYRSMGMVKEAEAIEAARVSHSRNLW